MITVYTYSNPVALPVTSGNMTVSQQLVAFQNGAYGLAVTYFRNDPVTRDDVVVEFAVRPFDGLTGQALPDRDLTPIAGPKSYDTELGQLSNGGFVGFGGGYDHGSFGSLQIFLANGTPLGPEIVLDDIGDPQSLGIATLSRGGFIATWDVVLSGARGTEIATQVFDDTGHPVTDRILIGGAGTQYMPKLALMPDDQFVECWIDNRNGHFLRAQVFDMTGHPVSTAITVQAAGNSTVNDSSIAALANGDFVVVWRELTTDDGISKSTIYMRVYAADGTPRNAASVLDTGDDSANGGVTIWEPRIVALQDGRFAVCWSGTGSNHLGTRGDFALFQVFEANGAAASPTYSLGANDGHQSHAQILALPDGRIAAVWDEVNSNGATIGRVTQIFDPRDHGIDLSGNGLADTYVGSVYQDRILGMNGNDQLFGWDGVDLLNGGLGADSLYGGAGGDFLIAGAGNDSLFGAEGDDRLNGGKGGDRLVGGAGRDLFVFLPGDGKDTIGGFVDGQDRISLAGYHFASFAAAKSHFATLGDGVRFVMGTDTIWVHGLTMAELTVGDLILV